MAAHVAQRVELTIDIGEHDALAIDGDDDHAARRHITSFDDWNKTVRRFGH
jgi:hypothetical protein